MEKQKERAGWEALENDLGFLAGRSMQPFGLRKEATEKENAQDHDDRDDDNFDQTHY
ncbi:MAG TPA: hypothetical protein VNO50_04490 [Pyrinomonadaceae bacterium]|nr:hypothetical protein [Pyrinomonadaceae bacterium]